ncbi:CRISPR-associated endonuclease Cas2 [Pseudoscardovia radai]|jgi:CRISPR-associated protein Cas2|uniref:CRISPR-associated endonuclease Cas2 n=1 Tax=Pseudoscardovia radai TaxID=987066 RepID=UPI003991E59D
MKKDEESGGMWCVVMFDLPVETKMERRAATQFRDLLLDQGFMMVQFSVYARYTPTLGGNRSSVEFIKKNIPAKGKVRILNLSDHQWAQSFHSYDSQIGNPNDGPTAPGALTLF